MAISEQLQQRINNLTQGMGATSNKEMEMFRDASPRMGFTRVDGLNTMPATPELTKPEIALERIKDIARNVEDPDELQRLLQVINNMSEQINQSKATLGGAISNKEMEMLRDASPSMGTMGGGDETQQAIDSLQQELQMTADPEEAGS